jgi:spermidine/putrescine-binding protein
VENKAMAAHKLLFLRLVGKIAIISFYIGLFVFFLYLPMVVEFFRPSLSINVCVFAETFCQEAIDRFQEKTGIKVNLSYAEIDEQIYAKFRMNEGAHYDVVNLSDYMIDMLKKQGLLHEIDPTKIKNMALLDQRLMHQTYDSGNVFSVPHKWYCYGLVYDKAFFNRSPDDMSLDFIFKDPQELQQQGLVSQPYRLCMLDDGRDALFMAAIYLFGRVDNLSPENMEQIKNLLIRQKQWVEAYTVHSSQYFLFANVTPIALMSSNYMRKILDNSQRFDFAIPKEGSMLIVENLAIPQRSKHVDLAHMFIDFMLSDEIAALNSKAYGYNSANKNAIKDAGLHYLANPHLFPDDTMFKRLFIPLLPVHLRKTLEELWLAVGFA